MKEITPNEQENQQEKIEAQADKEGNKKKNDSKINNKSLLIISGVIVLVVALIGALYLFSNDARGAAVYPGVEVDDGVEKGTIPVDDEELVVATSSTIDGEQFTFNVNQNPVFKNGTSEGNLLLESPENNTYFFSVSIQLDETQEVVYESGAVPAGYYIPTIELNTDLDKGSYPATMIVNVYDVETNEKMGAIASQLTLEIEG